MNRKAIVIGIAALAGVAFAASRANAAEGEDDSHPDDDSTDGGDLDDPPVILEPPGPVVEPPSEPSPVIDDPFGDLPPPPSGTDRKPKHLGNLPGGTDPVDPRKPKHLGNLPGETDDDGPSFEELLAEYPRGARFYQVVTGDKFGGTNGKTSIAYRYLLSEAYLAAIEYGGLTEDEAKTWALAVAKNDKVRAKVIDLIQCSGWNDALYGANPKAGTRTSQNGRSILLLQLHAPVSQMLANGEQPVRNATSGGGLINKGWRNLECLWLPALNREALYQSGGTMIDTTTGDTAWADGTSMENPPPWVMALGMDDNTGELHGSFGCPGSEGELEIE